VQTLRRRGGAGEDLLGRVACYQCAAGGGGAVSDGTIRSALRILTAANYPRLAKDRLRSRSFCSNVDLDQIVNARQFTIIPHAFRTAGSLIRHTGDLHRFCVVTFPMLMLGALRGATTANGAR
jgi:hypothetical protein